MERFPLGAMVWRIKTYQHEIASFHHNHKNIKRSPGDEENCRHQEEQNICPSSPVGTANHSRGGVVFQNCLGRCFKDEIDLEIDKNHDGGWDYILQGDA